MKYTALKAFEKHLQGASPQHFSDCYLLLSKDEFQRKQAVDMLLNFLLAGQKNAELLVSPYESENCQIQGVLQELNTFSLFLGKRVIVLHQVDKLPKASQQSLESYLQKANRQAYLVLTAASIHGGSTFYKKIEKAGVILEIAEEKAWEKEKSSAEWVQTLLAKEQRQIDPSACQLLIKQVGPEQATLFQEIQKLICYVGDRPAITMHDIQAICIQNPIETLWQLGESIFKRDLAHALKISKNLLQEGVQLLALLRQVRAQFQTDFQVCCILHGGGGPEEIAKAFPYMRGFILDLHVKMARHYGFERFKRGLLYLDEAELKAKNSQMDPTHLLEKLIVQLVV